MHYSTGVMKYGGCIYFLQMVKRRRLPPFWLIACNLNRHRQITNKNLFEHHYNSLYRNEIFNVSCDLLVLFNFFGV